MTDKKIKKCPKHGDYEVKYFEVMGMRIEKDNCSTCAAERNEKLKAERIEQERISINSAKIERRVRAGISKRNLLKGFDYITAETPEQIRAKAKCEAFADALISGKRDMNLILSGGVGAGKTLLASAIIDKACSRLDCRIIEFMTMVKKIRDTYSNNQGKTERELIKQYSSYDLLVIDEIGVQKNSEDEKILIFEILDARYKEMLPTVLISNMDMKGIESAVGSRIIDRLRESGGKLITFDWESKRRPV